MAHWSQFVSTWRRYEKAKGSSDEATRGDALSAFTDAYASLSRAAASDLQLVIRNSSQLFAPLEDPFGQPLGRNRWLHPDRTKEVGYSDWLAWLLEQLDSPIAVLRLFNLHEGQFAESLGKLTSNFTVDREYSFNSAGTTKFLDILVQFQDSQSPRLLLVEVKRKPFEQATGTDTLPHYLKWLQNRQPLAVCREAVLLVNSIEDDWPDAWHVVTWEHIALSMRKLAAALVKRRKNPNLLLAASMLNFAGAVEQNLLGLAFFRRGANLDFNAPKVAAYLERSIWRVKHGW